MKFFNKKQDVIDIQLTSYGKKKLANGNFSPVFYCFFDDNIIYDGQYGAIVENQNAIQTRILENMEYLKLNPLITGVETKLKERNKEIFETDDEIISLREYYGDCIQNTEDREKVCQHKLGNSRLGDQKAPSYQIFSAGAPFVTSSFNSHYSGSGILQEIPQIDISLTHSATHAPENQLRTKNQFQEIIYPDDINLTTFAELSQTSYDDRLLGTMIRLEGDFLVLDFKEKNTKFENENYEFEVYEIVTKENVTIAGEAKEELVPLQLKNTSGLPSTDPDASYINNYMEILTDLDIPQVFRDALPSLQNPTDNINTGIITTGAAQAAAAIAAAMARANTNNADTTYPGNDQDPEDCS